jgi:hypothetical protein
VPLRLNGGMQEERRGERLSVAERRASDDLQTRQDLLV